MFRSRPHSRRAAFGVLFVVASIAPNVAGCQAPRDSGVALITPATLRRTLDSLRTAGQQSRELSERGTFHYLAMQRTQTGRVEVHAEWTDIFVVTDGAGQLRHSGRAGNGRTSAPGEYRGGVMTNGRLQDLSIGDVVVIPAGTAHQIVLAPGQRIGYLAIKLHVPRMPLPNDP